MSDLADRFRIQARGCAELGSPMYAALLRNAVDDIIAGGVVADVLADYEADRTRSALALRLLGAVHRLVLDGRVPGLSVHYPSVGGTADPLAAWPAFRKVLHEHRATIRAGLDTPPQTNEVGRATGLIGGLLILAATTGLPVRLLEIGTSAGLNLRADHFRYGFGDGRSHGPADSPVVLPDAWTSGAGRPPLDAPLNIIERAGCDVAPIDPTSDEGRLRLLSYVWPDQLDRIARLRGALELAAHVPATVVRATAAAFLDGVKPRPGVATVVWHSIMWQYLPHDERERVAALLDAAGAAATANAPFAHLALEPRLREGPGTNVYYALTLRLWPDGREQILGEAPAHGLPMIWYGHVSPHTRLK